MALTEVLPWYNLVLGVFTSLGLLYLLYLQQFVVGNRRFLLVTTTGLLLVTGVAPVVEMVAGDVLHLVHGVGALLVIFGLYNPVYNDLRRDEWATLIMKNPSDVRHEADWMVPMDDEILSLFYGSDLVLTPAILAYNLDHSREAVNRRLSELADEGLVERVERGKYRISPIGEEYLSGESGWPEATGTDGSESVGPEAAH
ncbi:MAG: hypothetical protein V5A33_04830 [Halobacteriales archaeon]